MITAVLDSSVLVAGAGWRGEAHLCLTAMARRRVRVFTSRWILEETHRAIALLRSSARDPLPVIAWFSERAGIVSPSSTGKRRCRDPKDAPVLGTALAAKAQLIVSYDQDLLVLQKPFGIEIVRPREFLARLQRPI